MSYSGFLPDRKIIVRQEERRTSVPFKSNGKIQSGDLKEKQKSVIFCENNGYEEFKIGAMLRQAREQVGITQEELANRIHTRKSAISRIENHADDIRLSTLRNIAQALGKHLEVRVA